MVRDLDEGRLLAETVQAAAFGVDPDDFGTAKLFGDFDDGSVVGSDDEWIFDGKLVGLTALWASRV